MIIELSKDDIKDLESGEVIKADIRGEIVGITLKEESNDDEAEMRG